MPSQAAPHTDVFRALAPAAARRAAAARAPDIDHH